MSEHPSARTIVAVLAALVLTVCTPVHSALLPPGGAILAPGEPDPTGGFVVGGGAAVPFASPAGPGQFSGTLTTTVIAGDPSNPFGGLTFVYRLTNDAVSQNSIGRLTIVDFSGFLTDVSYQIPAAGLAPTSVNRSIGAGTTIGWDFTGVPVGLGKLNPGAGSAVLVVQTNALAFTDDFANVIDGAVVQVPSLGPTVPEPAMLSLLALGYFVRRHRRI